jgi:hypothetical protein
MSASKDCLADWRSKGFARDPEVRRAGEDGLLMYRCWGGSSSEWGTGYFCATKPTSVSDAEFRYNIVDWGNCIRKVSTFRLKPHFPYFVGPVAHGEHDFSISAEQIYVEAPLAVKVELIQCENLKQDFTVVRLNFDKTKSGQERGQA